MLRPAGRAGLRARGRWHCLEAYRRHVLRNRRYRRVALRGKATESWVNTKAKGSRPGGRPNEEGHREAGFSADLPWSSEAIPHKSGECWGRQTSFKLLQASYVVMRATV
ncbi:hypothetical protein BKA56DRAFT_597793 [Ilyonectria sp. MPI-CAGE-AT-0026]|nr:hypothetical protein BKA56DRAFT_597793 [Ilyonectria sp. MPI-CAGE-AT-0026]